MSGPTTSQRILAIAIGIKKASEVQAMICNSPVSTMQASWKTSPDYDKVQSSWQTPAPSSTHHGVILKPLDNDVILGRSKDCFNHEGNRQFRLIIATYCKSYQHCPTRKGQKIAFVNGILDDLRQQKFRFLKPCDDGSSGFFQVDDNTARGKVAHAIRDANTCHRRKLERKVTREECTRKPDVPTSTVSSDHHQYLSNQEQEVVIEKEADDKGEDAAAEHPSHPTIVVSNKSHFSAASLLVPTSNYNGDDDFLGEIEPIPLKSYITPDSISCCRHDTSTVVDDDNGSKDDSEVLDEFNDLPLNKIMLYSSAPLRTFADNQQ
jgi:hypothetical protein